MGSDTVGAGFLPERAGLIASDKNPSDELPDAVGLQWSYVFLMRSSLIFGVRLPKRPYALVLVAGSCLTLHYPLW